MIIARNDESRPDKGWYIELAHPALPFIGFANQGINEPHYHISSPRAAAPSSWMMFQSLSILETSSPSSLARCIRLSRTRRTSHFVLHCPPVKGDKAVVPLRGGG